MATISQRQIPVLKKNRSRKGSNLIISRNFDTGRVNYRRFYKEEGVTFKVSLDIEKEQNVIVLLHSNISGEWKDYPFERKGVQEFELYLKGKKTGTSQFKVRFSLNDGKTFFWDNVPHSSLFIDPQSLKNLKMYTLIPTVTGHIGNWIDELYRIKSMGFNSIHLLPLTFLDSSESPYSAKRLFSIDDSYLNPNDQRGEWEQFEDFILVAQELELKLCFDIVLNHVGVTSDIVKDASTWIITDVKEKDGLKRAGCWDHSDWVSWRDIVLLEYDHPNKKIKKEIWDHMSDYLLFWAHYASHTDGIVRLDNLHSTNREFLEYVIQKVKTEYPELIIFAELFTDMQTLEKMVYYNEINLLLATPWVAPFAHDFRHFISNLHSNEKQIKYLFPLNSHDSKTPAHLYGGANSLIPRYAASVFMGTGQVGLVQGVEFGAPQKINFIGRQKYIKMDHTTWGEDYSYVIKDFHDLFDRFDLFQQGGNLTFIDGGHGAILGAVRISENEKILILINFDMQNKQKIKIDRECFSSSRSLNPLWGSVDEYQLDDKNQFFLNAGEVLLYSF